MNPPSTALLQMKEVKLSFGKKLVLRDVNLEVRADEVLVIMGLSGGGKSTLLRLILGLLKVDSGSILFKQSEITKVSRPKLNELRSHIGMVYQGAALISSMSVRENISLPLEELTNKKRSEINAIVEHKLEMVGLSDVIDLQPSELSGGMAKRVGLARALALEPELILFDEPSAGLDPINSALINDLIISLHKTHRVTCVVVTHEMPSAFAIATRMAMLNNGRIVAEGSPEEFRSSTDPFISKFLASYLAGTPQGK